MPTMVEEARQMYTDATTPEQSQPSSMVEEARQMATQPAVSGGSSIDASIPRSSSLWAQPIVSEWKPNQCDRYVATKLTAAGWQGQRASDIRSPKFGTPTQSIGDGTVIHLRADGPGTTNHWATTFVGNDGQTYLNELQTGNGKVTVKTTRPLASVQHRVDGAWMPKIGGNPVVPAQPTPNYPLDNSREGKILRKAMEIASGEGRSVLVQAALDARTAGMPSGSVLSDYRMRPYAYKAMKQMGLKSAGEPAHQDTLDQYLKPSGEPLTGNEPWVFKTPTTPPKWWNPNGPTATMRQATAEDKARPALNEMPESISRDPFYNATGGMVRSSGLREAVDMVDKPRQVIAENVTGPLLATGAKAGEAIAERSLAPFNRPDDPAVTNMRNLGETLTFFTPLGIPAAAGMVVPDDSGVPAVISMTKDQIRLMANPAQAWREGRIGDSILGWAVLGHTPKLLKKSAVALVDRAFPEPVKAPIIGDTTFRKLNPNIDPQVVVDSAIKNFGGDGIPDHEAIAKARDLIVRGRDEWAAFEPGKQAAIARQNKTTPDVINSVHSETLRILDDAYNTETQRLAADMADPVNAKSQSEISKQTNIDRMAGFTFGQGRKTPGYRREGSKTDLVIYDVPELLNQTGLSREELSALIEQGATGKQSEYRYQMPEGGKRQFGEIISDSITRDEAMALQRALPGANLGLAPKPIFGQKVGVKPKQGAMLDTPDDFQLVQQKAKQGTPMPETSLTDVETGQMTMTGTDVAASGGGYKRPESHPAPLVQAKPISRVDVQSDFNPMEMPELVQLTKEINGGKYPAIVKKIRALNGQARGVFKSDDKGNANIELKADIFLGDEKIAIPSKMLERFTDDQLMGRESSDTVWVSTGKPSHEGNARRVQNLVAKEMGVDPSEIVVRWERDPKLNDRVYKAYHVNEYLAPQVFSHEIGHMIDWMPDATLKRGNILGHIAALRRAMVETMGEMPSNPVESLPAKVRDQLRRSAAKELADSGLQDVELRNEISRLYQSKLREEISRRGLMTAADVMTELKHISKRWKPFDDSNPKAPYTKYRYSPKELYADAVSVLFNEPELLRKEAPTFYKAFMNYLKARPQVRKSLQSIQDRYTNPEAIADRQIGDIYGMFERGNEARSSAVAKRKQSVETVVDSLMRGLVDEAHAALKGIRVRETRGGIDADLAHNARLAIEESRYIDGKVDDYIYTANRDLLQQMTEAGVSYEDVAAVGFLRRVLADREHLANPLGQVPSTARKRLADLEARFGPEKFAVVDNVLTDYRNMRESTVLNDADVAQLYGPALLEEMRTNKDYLKFSVTKYLEKKFGGQVSAAVHKQIGTLSEIENPFVATVLQDISMIRAAKLNKAKTELLLDLVNAKTAIPAETVYSRDVMGKVAKPPTNPELALFTVMKDGKPVHFYVDKEIAKTFEYEPVKAMAIAQWWGVANGVLRDLLVSKNPLWQARNVIRDVRGTIKNVNEIGIRDIPRLGKFYKQALGEVYREVFKGERSADLSNALKEGAIPSGRVYSAYDTAFPNEIERLAHDFVHQLEQQKTAPPIIRQIKAVYRFLDRTGRISEMTGPLAGYKYFKETQPQIGTRERAHIVRTRVGTPDFKRRGAWHTITNNVFMFSNVNKEGLRSAVEAYRDNPVRYTWKTVAFNILPKATLAAVGAYYANTSLGKAINKADEYDKRMYTVIPIGLVNDGQDAIYLRIPEDYEGQAISAAIWDASQGKLFGKEGLLGLVAAQNPYKPNPLLNTGLKLFQYYGQGINPVDEYRGKNVLSDRAYAAGGKYAAKQMAAYIWNQLGGSSIYRMPTGPEVEQNESKLQKALRMPGASVLGAFLRISHNGESSKLYSITDKIRGENAAKSLDKQSAIVTAANSGLSVKQAYDELGSKGLIDTDTTSINEFAATYRRYQARKGGNSWITALTYAQSNEEKRAILNDCKAKLDTEQFNRTMDEVIMNKLISDDLAKDYGRRIISHRLSPKPPRPSLR